MAPAKSKYKSILDDSDGDSGREELKVDPDKLLSLNLNDTDHVGWQYLISFLAHTCN
jgi:hypothetical protein